MIRNKRLLALTIITLGLTFADVVNASATKDISGHWAKEQIQKFIDNGYINGYEDNTFRPNNAITRAEFVKIFNKYFGLTEKSGKVFSDTKNHWAKDEIDVAITNGVCNGVSSTEFKPNDFISREQAALMIANYRDIAMKVYPNNSEKIRDISEISSWAKFGVFGVMDEKYMQGYEDDTFRPKGKITRGETVVTLSRLDNKESKLNKIVVDSSDIKIEFKSFKKNEYGHYVIKSNITNNTSKSVKINIKDSYINGKANEMNIMSNTVLPNSTLSRDIVIDSSKENISSFNDLLNASMSGILQVIDSDSYDIIINQEFSIGKNSNEGNDKYKLVISKDKGGALNVESENALIDVTFGYDAYGKYFDWYVYEFINTSKTEELEILVLFSNNYGSAYKRLQPGESGELYDDITNEYRYEKIIINNKIEVEIDYNF